MKKNISICLLLVLLTGCFKLYEPDYSGFYLTEYGGIHYSEGNFYLDHSSDTISILENNEFVDYMKKKDGYLFLFNEENSLYIEDAITNEIYEIGKLDENDIEFKKYKLDYYNSSDDYIECRLLYDDNPFLDFIIDNRTIKGHYSLYMYYIDNYIYITSLRYAYGGGPFDDKNINGQDFLGSDLYKIDIENKQVELIYSTDNTQAIAYGNENIVYYSDDKYNLHKLNIKNGQDTIVYEGNGCKDMVVSYTHNIFYISTDLEDKVIDVDFDYEE